jgi:hypothetical protein
LAAAAIEAAGFLPPATDEWLPPSEGQEQSALHSPGHFDFSPQSYQQLQSGTSSVALQVKL